MKPTPDQEALWNEDRAKAEAYAIAWVSVYHPNMSDRAKRGLVNEMMHSANREMHVLSLEANFEAFQMHLEKLQPVNEHVAKMRERYYTGIGSRFRSKKRTVQKFLSAKGKYWKRHGQPIVQQMKSVQQRLESQLEDTEMCFADLAAEFRLQIAQTIAGRATVKSEKEPAKPSRILTAWEDLCKAVSSVMKEGQSNPPAIEHQMLALRQEIDALGIVT